MVLHIEGVDELARVVRLIWISESRYVQLDRFTICQSLDVVPAYDRAPIVPFPKRCGRKIQDFDCLSGLHVKGSSKSCVIIL